MFESKELRVKPVRRYRTPRYPSHTQPDPTLHPTLLAYPACSKLLAAVAAIGVAAITSCDAPAANHAAPTATAGTAPLDATDPTTVSFSLANLPVTSTPDVIKGPLINPFRVALSGLPYRTYPCGTGQPHYLDEAIARRAIEETFQKAGYHLAARHRYHQGDVALAADGYDVEKKVGYVVAYYANLSNDAIISWRHPNSRANAEEAMDRLVGRISDDAMMATFVAEIQAAKKLPDPAKRGTAYRAILVQAGQHNVSLAEMKQLEEPVANHQDFVAVISLFDPRFHVRPVYEPIELRQLLEPQGLENDNNESELEISLAAEDFSSFEVREKSAERSALLHLQQAVREYIVWARSQGAQ